MKLLLLNAKDKDKDPKSSSLMAHLRKIDEHLGRKGTRFLTGDTMCCFDCELMPRLQHIRVAGKYFANFEIPESLVHLWRYMHHMYRLDAFLQSCPADQDIINHYKLQQVKFIYEINPFYYLRDYTMALWISRKIFNHNLNAYNDYAFITK